MIDAPKEAILSPVTKTCVDDPTLGLVKIVAGVGVDDETDLPT